MTAVPGNPRRRLSAAVNEALRITASKCPSLGANPCFFNSITNLCLTLKPSEALPVVVPTGSARGIKRSNEGAHRIGMTPNEFGCRLATLLQDLSRQPQILSHSPAPWSAMALTLGHCPKRHQGVVAELPINKSTGN